jgi:hypothetical protein
MSEGLACEQLREALEKIRGERAVACQHTQHDGTSTDLQGSASVAGDAQRVCTQRNTEHAYSAAPPYPRTLSFGSHPRSEAAMRTTDRLRELMKGRWEARYLQARKQASMLWQACGRQDTCREASTG